jgi:hypothetical protein
MNERSALQSVLAHSSTGMGVDRKTPSRKRGRKAYVYRNATTGYFVK